MRPLPDVLLKVEPADYSRLIARRRNAAIAPFLICTALATAIIVVEYRLMLISFVVFVPALVGVIDVVAVSRQARRLGACEVRCDGQWLSLNHATRLSVESIIAVRVEPDAIRVVEQLSPKKWTGHLLAAEGAAQSPLVTKLEALGRKVIVEKVTIYTLMAFLWAVLANLILDKVAAVLVLGAIAYTGKGFMGGTGPGWEAAACFGGAVLCVTVIVVLKKFVLERPQDPNANRFAGPP
jgi:hypothetical protein